MKCYRHIETDAHAVCANCGRGICQACITTPEGRPAACSEACAIQTNQIRQALEMTAAKMLRSNSVNAKMMWLCGAVFLLAGIVLIATKDPFLIAFPIALGLTFVVAGFWYRRVGRREG